MGDLVARGFPRDLDGHPALAWMGDDWVTFVALRLLEELRRQDPATAMSEVACLVPPAMETAVAADGRVRRVILRLELALWVVSGDGADHLLEGRATVAGPDPLGVAFDVAGRHDRLAAVLRDARALAVRSDNDFAWSSWKDAADAVEELDGQLAALGAGDLRVADVAGIFAPTGPLHELAVSSGWAPAFSRLADRFDAIPSEAGFDPDVRRT